MPGYELYGQALKEGALKGQGQKQLRITVDKERKVVEVEDIENGGNA